MSFSHLIALEPINFELSSLPFAINVLMHDV